MGLGKTLSVLATFQYMCETSEVEFLLVVCPNSLTRNWVREAGHWTKDVRLAQLPQAKKERGVFLQALLKGDLELYDGLVINYESLRLKDVYPQLTQFVAKRKVWLCLDESQRAKNPTSKTFMALKAIAPLCKRRVLLSGTPVPRDITDIWAQMLLIDGGAAFWLKTIMIGFQK